MSRITYERIRNVWNTAGHMEKSITQDPSKQFAFCPFTIILGAINSTNAGYKPPTSIPADYTSFSKIFTGREAIIAVWDNSYDIIQTDPSNPNPDNSFKKFKARGGDAFYGWVVSDSVGIQYSTSAANNAFIQEQAVKNVVMNIPNNDLNSEWINNLLTNTYKLYMIPEVNASRTTSGFQVDRQWYYIEVASKMYNPETKLLDFIQVTFVSLNDKLATTGMAINQYVQLGAPGDPVAVPYLDNEGFITLDPYYIQPMPVTHIQVSYYGNVGPISFAFWGRDIDNTHPLNLAFKQYPSKLLFPWQWQASTYDPVSFQALPETNYVLTVSAESVTDTYIDTWQKIVAPMYDDDAKKNYEGHVKTDFEKTSATNPVNTLTGSYTPYWDNNFLNNLTVLDNNNIKLIGNPYFQYYNPNTKQYVGITQGYNFTFNNLLHRNLSNINMYQYFVYNPVVQIPLSVRETLKISLSSIPLFGTFWNVFTHGLDVGFKIGSDIIIPKFPYINFLMSAELYNFYTQVLYSSYAQKNIMPYDVFRNGTPDTIGAIAGAPAQMTSFTFNLTDRVNLALYNADTGVKKDLSIRETTYLGQNFMENGENLVSLVEDVQGYLAAPILTDDTRAKWAIDLIDLKVQGKCNYKVTTYSMPQNRNGAVSDEYATWAGTYETVGKASDDIRLITNTTVIANNTWKFNNPYTFPKQVIPPPPKPTVHPIFIDLSSKKIKSDGKVYISENLTGIQPTNMGNYQIFPTTNVFDPTNQIQNRTFLQTININDYGYTDFNLFKADYKYLQLNLSGTIKDFSSYGNKDVGLLYSKNITKSSNLINSVNFEFDLLNNSNDDLYFEFNNYQNSDNVNNDANVNFSFNMNGVIPDTVFVNKYLFNQSDGLGAPLKIIIADNNSSGERGFINTIVVAQLSLQGLKLYLRTTVYTLQSTFNYVTAVPTRSDYQLEKRTTTGVFTQEKYWSYSNWEVNGQNVQVIPR